MSQCVPKSDWSRMIRARHIWVLRHPNACCVKRIATLVVVFLYDPGHFCCVEIKESHELSSFRLQRLQVQRQKLRNWDVHWSGRHDPRSPGSAVVRWKENFAWRDIHIVSRCIPEEHTSGSLEQHLKAYFALYDCDGPWDVQEEGLQQKLATVQQCPTYLKLPSQNALLCWINVSLLRRKLEMCASQKESCGTSWNHWEHQENRASSHNLEIHFRIWEVIDI